MIPARLVPALAAAILLAGCQAETAPVEHAPRPVQVATVAYQAEGTRRDFVGIIAPRTETAMAFRLGGKLVARLVDVGDRVTAGEVIARLDPQDLQLQFESAEAELAAATAAVAQASADLDRFAALKKRGFATIADFDRKTSGHAEAAARLERAQRSLDLAKRQLGYAELRADADGVITATPAEPGQVVAAGQPVATLAHDGDKEALIALPEDWFAEARDAAATVTLWADGEHGFAATLRELSPQADPATRTYAARFALAGATDAVAFGMTATVRLEKAGAVPVARLPLAAVVNDGSGARVFVVDASDTLHARPVTVAAFTGDAALVTGGVEDGDRVVTLGVQKLEDGQRVRTVAAR